MEESNAVLKILKEENDKVRKRLHDFIDADSTYKVSIEAKIIRLEDKVAVREPCNLHITSMEKLNNNVNDIKMSTAEIKGRVDGFILGINEFMKLVKDDIYKDGGIMTKVSSNKNQTNLQWGVLTIILAGAISLFVWRR